MLVRDLRAAPAVETHVSRVHLLERDVFKLKKPVDLGFLDFRTLPQRLAACEAEVRLNARLAPGVYLGVEPVREREGGAVVDWAVHMKRLPDRDRADEVLARGALGPRDLDAVARRIAAFHGACRSDAETANFGEPLVVADNLEENFLQVGGTIERYLDRREAAEVIGWQRAFLRDNAALFAARARDGRVRDGHGDLRLEHVYLRGGEVVVIDCIEFNERFRFADVCADVAFLAMDLAAHGRVDLAERFLASYARAADDFDLYALVDFYGSYRAFVRGKIAALVGAHAAARRYFRLALAADRRQLLTPAVVAVGGWIAAGKSTIAEELAAELDAPVIDADRTRKAMLGLDPTKPVHAGAFVGAYDPRFTERVYEEVLRRARVVVASGRPVVVDASFRSRAARAAARAVAVLENVPFTFVECVAPPEVCRARLRERATRRDVVSDGRLDVFDDFVARFEPVIELSRAEHVVVDTTRSIATTAAELRTHVSTWPERFVS